MAQKSRKTSIFPLEGKLRPLTKVNGTKYHNAWNYAHTRRFLFALNIDKERDMIDWLESRKPMQTTIKRLIRAEMERERQESIRTSETPVKPR